MAEYRRKLPHLQPEDAYLFVTWRLWGSMPAKPEWVVYPNAGHEFVARDRELDRCRSGPRWLAEPRVADLVARAILRGESEWQLYELRAWVVMPNHVHLLIVPKVAVPVMMRWLKGSSARYANGLLGRTGRPFWQDESYDHYLRKADEVQRTVRYVERNPVTAGLVSAAERWRWSSAGWQAETPAPPLSQLLLED